MTVGVNIERELCRSKSVLRCLSVRGKQRTFTTWQELVLDTIDATDLGRVLSLLRRTKAEYFVDGLQKALCVQGFKANGLEAVHARPAQLCAREVDRARPHGDVIFRVDPQRVVLALQKPVERRLFLPCTTGRSARKS